MDESQPVESILIVDDRRVARLRGLTHIDTFLSRQTEELGVIFLLSFRVELEKKKRVTLRM